MAADPAHRTVRGAFAPADEEMIEEAEEEDNDDSPPATVSAGWTWTGRDTERSVAGRELTRRRSGDGLPFVPRPRPRQEPPPPSYAELLRGPGGSGDGGSGGSGDGGGSSGEVIDVFSRTASGDGERHTDVVDGGDRNPSLKIESAVLIPYTDSGAASPAATAATAAATNAAIASAAAASAASAAAAAAAMVGTAVGDELRVAPMLTEATADSRVSPKGSAGATDAPAGVAVWASIAASSDVAGTDHSPRRDPYPRETSAATSTGGDVKNALLQDQINARTATVAQTTSPPRKRIEPTGAERQGKGGAEERGATWEAATAAAAAATVVATEADVAALPGKGGLGRGEEGSPPAEATAVAVEGKRDLGYGDLSASAKTTRPYASVETQPSIQQVLIKQEPSADGASRAESDRVGAGVVGSDNGGVDSSGGEGGGDSACGVVVGGGVQGVSTAGGVPGRMQAVEMLETEPEQCGGTKRTAGTPASMVIGEGVQVEGEAGSSSQGDWSWMEGAVGADVEPNIATPRPVEEVETQGVEKSVATAAEVPPSRGLVGSPPLVSSSVSGSEEVVPLVDAVKDVAARGAETSVSSLRSAVEQTEPAVAVAAVAASEAAVKSSKVDVASAREKRVPSSQTRSGADENIVESSAAAGVSPSSQLDAPGIVVTDTASPQASRHGNIAEVDIASTREDRVPSSQTPAEVDQVGIETSAVAGVPPRSRLGTSDTAVIDAAATHQARRDGNIEVESAEADVASVRDNRVPSSHTRSELYEEGVESSATAASVSSPLRLGAPNIAVTDTSAHQANREGEGVAAAAAAGAGPLVGNTARGRKIDSLARTWEIRDNRGGESDSAVDLADAAAEETTATAAAAQTAILTPDVHAADPEEIDVDATCRHVANRGAEESEVRAGVGAEGSAMAAGVAVALSAIKNVVAPALPLPETVGGTIDEVVRRGGADESRPREETREIFETVVGARNGPASVTVREAPARGERKTELSRWPLETAPVGTVLEAGTSAVDFGVVPEMLDTGGGVDVAAEDVGTDDFAATPGNAAAADLEPNLALSAKSRKRETLPATGAEAAAVALTSNGNRTRRGSVLLRSRSCSASAWPGPEDLGENFPRITVEEAAAFMGSAADGFGVGAAGFGHRFASKPSWTSTATSAIADIHRSVSSPPPSTPTQAARVGGQGTSEHGGGVHHDGFAPEGSASVAAALAVAGRGGTGEAGVPVWGEAAFGSFPGIDHFLSSSVDGFSGVRARRVGSDVPYSRTRTAGDGYRRAAVARRSNSLDAGDFSATGGMDDRRRSTVDGAVGVRGRAPTPALGSESGRLGGSDVVGVSRGEDSPAVDNGGGGAVTITEEKVAIAEEKVVEKEEVAVEAAEEVGGEDQNGGKSEVPLQQILIAPGGGGSDVGGGGGDDGGGGSGVVGGNDDGSFGNGGTNPLSSTALAVGAATSVEKPVGVGAASGAWVEQKGGAVVVAQEEGALGSGSVSKPSAAPVITTSAATSLLDNGGEGRLESPLIEGGRGRPGSGSGAHGRSGGGGGCCVMS